MLQEEREASFGDPVRGIETPFLRTFDDVNGAADAEKVMTLDAETMQAQGDNSAPETLLNHFVKVSELERATSKAASMARPWHDPDRPSDPAQEQMENDAYTQGNINAARAIPTILSLANASQQQRTRANVQRCIETFGRHKTDAILAPRPPVNPLTLPANGKVAEKTPRAGPDTGSSEVQIAILTAKIRRLADELEREGAGNKDKSNKHALRLLVHRRQKLLQYLRRKERGGGRWQRVTEMMGLTEGTWQGEISL